jgi:uncharacterized repeat protein (TIGR03803 family)
MPNKRLRSTILRGVFAMFFAAATFAFGQTPAPVYTFVCTGPQDQGNCPDGGVPNSITQGSNGTFYGTAAATTESTGQSGGLVFSLTSSGEFSVLYKFTPGAKGNFPDGEDPIQIFQGPDGKLYGETGVGGAYNVGTLFRLNTDGSGFQLLHSFCVSCANGYNPQGMVAGADGNVYGTTEYGGENCEESCGGIFQINVTTGSYKLVRTLGLNPSNMVVGPNGTLYGLEDGPGMFNYNALTGGFQVTKLALTGVPVYPVFGTNGNLYGLSENALKGVGLFEVQPNGTGLQTFPIIANFGLIEGEATPLVLGSDGNLWMTRFGGTFGNGEILTFSSTNGSLIQAISPFAPTASVGAYPSAMIPATGGTLWGTTTDFGDVPSGDYGQGVVFSLTLE